MSYILDALKRADAERQRGAAPGLHAVHALPTGDATKPGASQRLGLVLAGVLAVVLVLGGVWLWQSSAAPATPIARNDPPRGLAPAPAESPLVATAPVLPAVTAQAAVPVSSEAAGVQPLPSGPAAAPEPAAAPSPALSRLVMPAPLRKPPPPAEAKPEPSPKATAPAKASSAAVALLNDLPDNLRSQIPKITITGSVYSSSPDQRLLLANNLVLNQGSHLTPELTLEEIQPKSSIFSFKGTRFRVVH